MTEGVIAAKSGTWLNFRYYAAWWALWCGLFTTLQPYIGPDDGFWLSKIVLAATGVAYGVALGAVYTVAQNTLNKARRKPVSWALAIGIAVLGKLLNLAFALA